MSKIKLNIIYYGKPSSVTQACLILYTFKYFHKYLFLVLKKNNNKY